LKASDRKKQILDAALTAFAEHGYERTSIAIICEKAGIARPTLYQYFSDKRSLFRELLENYLIGVHDRIHARQKAESENKNLSMRESLNSLHLELFEEISNNRDIHTILVKEARARNAETEDVTRGIMKMMIGRFVNAMETELCENCATIADKEFAAVYMMGGTMNAVEYFLFDKVREMTTREFAERITEIESKIFGFEEKC